MWRQTLFFIVGFFIIILLAVFAYARMEKKNDSDSAVPAEQIVVARSPDELVRTYESQMQALHDEIERSTPTAFSSSTIADRMAAIPVPLEFRDQHMALFLLTAEGNATGTERLIAAFDMLLQHVKTLFPSVSSTPVSL